MDIGVIIALCVAVTFTLISGIAAGLFGGMWWQARQTAQVWEKAYTHVREQLQIKRDTYNTAQPKSDRDPRAFGDVGGPADATPPRDRVRVQAATNVPEPALAEVRPSQEAQRYAGLDAGLGERGGLDFELDDDPHGPQIKC